jgi:hypothetical protein
LFKLAIGGYGLFGVISTIKLRLMPRTRLKRTVKVIDIDALIPAFEERIEQGYMYGGSCTRIFCKQAALTQAAQNRGSLSDVCPVSKLWPGAKCTRQLKGSTG